MAKLKSKTAVNVEEIRIPPLNIQRANITLIGDSELIVHRWSEKAKKEMLDKQMGKALPAKAPKDPEQDYQDSLYKIPGGGFAFPAVAFKSAAVDACSQVANITKVDARAAFHIMGEMVTIKGTPHRREDMVRIGMGTADIRYRGGFAKWSCTFEVRYNANVLTIEQIMNLFNTAGFGVGVGEWRSQKDGSFGMFHVATEQEMRKAS